MGHEFRKSVDAHPIGSRCPPFRMGGLMAGGVGNVWVYVVIAEAVAMSLG